jgi:hypothetical protein
MPNFRGVMGARRTTQIRRALGMAALFLLAVSYLPHVYGPDPGLTPRFHPSTIAVMVGAALTGIATALHARREPHWNGYGRTTLRGLMLASVVVSAIGVAVYVGLVVWSESHISQWDNFYCRVDLFPEHRNTCVASNTQFANGFRDGVRAGLWFLVGARSPARQSGRLRTLWAHRSSTPRQDPTRWPRTPFRCKGAQRGMKWTLCRM